MTNDGREMYWVLRAALPASLVLHLIIIALLMFGLPVSLATPQKEDAISVDIVPPPKPEEKPAAKPETPPKPAEKAEAPPPEPVKKAETPPAEKPKAEPQAQPEKPAAQPQPEKPVVDPKEAKAETPPPAAETTADKETKSTFKPVVQFGDKDAGPRQAPDGSSAEDLSAPEKTKDTPDQQDVTKAPAINLNELTAEAPKPDADAKVALVQPDAAEAPQPLKLQEAKTLFSPEATSNPQAMTAMRNTPRGIRAGRLCLTELRAQLQHAEPAYLADLLPTDALRDGSTAIDIADAAFRADLKWYHLGYRCEVDGDAMKVVSFAYRVGTPIPRSEWKQRGLPAQ